ncbi:MAG: hypothetical protein IKA36_00620 [Clostridia bacterium]|nr:hypothetical protein [Clostridia bacterium]
MIAIVIAKLTTAKPVRDMIMFLKYRLSVVPKVVSIAVSKVKIETQPAINDIVFAEE